MEWRQGHGQGRAMGSSWKHLERHFLEQMQKLGGVLTRHHLEAFGDLRSRSTERRLEGCGELNTPRRHRFSQCGACRSLHVDQFDWVQFVTLWPKGSVSVRPPHI